MFIMIYTIWIAVLLGLIIGVFTLSNKNKANYSLKKRNVLLVALIIQILCSLVFLAIFMSEVFNAYPSI